MWGLAALLVNLSGCGLTTVQSEWKMEDFKGRFAKVLVMAQFPDSAERALVEEALVADLTGRGVEAIAGRSRLKDSPIPNLYEVATILDEEGFDGALFVYLVGTSSRTTYFRRVFGASYRNTTLTPGASSTQKVMTVEADLFESEHKRRVWFLVAETVMDEGSLPSNEKALESLVDALSGSIAGKRLLPR
jgi:hypothetical protein